MEHEAVRSTVDCLLINNLQLLSREVLCFKYLMRCDNCQTVLKYCGLRTQCWYSQERQLHQQLTGTTMYGFLGVLFLFAKPGHYIIT